MHNGLDTKQNNKMFANQFTKSIPIITFFVFSNIVCNAQVSNNENKTKSIAAKSDSIDVSLQPAEVKLGYQNFHGELERNRNFGYTPYETGGKQDINKVPNSSFPLNEQVYDKKRLNFDRYGISAVSTKNHYPYLLFSNSATFAHTFQEDNLSLTTRIIANRYETNHVTAQFGISGYLEYRLSQHWSMAIWGTLYNRNPYFSLATYPFVETSSYGGWLKYEREKFSIKLGTRRYYDSFRRQWRTEPIVTPSIKFGKKFVMDLPIGPLIQKSMEKILKKNRNNGPMIMPNFD